MTPPHDNAPLSYSSSTTTTTRGAPGMLEGLVGTEAIGTCSPPEGARMQPVGVPGGARSRRLACAIDSSLQWELICRSRRAAEVA
jgi:hypothetical protein